MVNLVQFIDQQDTRSLVLQGPQQRPGTEELLAVQFRSKGLLINIPGLRFEFNAESLKGLIESADRFVFVNPLVALQALNRAICSVCNCIPVFPLPAGPSRSSGLWSLAER